MSLIVEYETEPRRATEALAARPTATLEHDEIHLTPADEVRWFFWARGVGAEFDDALAADPTIERHRVVTETPEDRLYSATLASSPGATVVPAFRHIDVQFLNATHGNTGAVVRVRCPSWERFGPLRQVVETTNGSFSARRIYRDGETALCRFNMTPAQREALTAALEAGYYEVPRDATLQEIASQLGISDSAASARLRRGVAGLLRWTLADPASE